MSLVHDVYVGEHRPLPDAVIVHRGARDEAGERYVRRGTCRDTGESGWFRCSECGFGFNDWYLDDESEINDQPRHCPNHLWGRLQDLSRRQTQRRPA